MKEMIKNKLLASVRISMLNVVDSLDEDMLKKELKENLQKRFELEDKLKEVRECINHYAIENEDYSKVYNDEEKELLEILDKEKE